MKRALASVAVLAGLLNLGALCARADDFALAPTGGTPSSTGEPLTVGFEFTTADPITITGVGDYDPDGNGNTIESGLWNTDGNVIFTEAGGFPGVQIGDDRYFTFGSDTFSIAPGTYIFTGETESLVNGVGDLPYDTDFTQSPGPGITIDQELFAPGPDLTFPTMTDGSSNPLSSQLVDFTYVPGVETPEPSTSLGLLFGAAGLLACMGLARARRVRPVCL